jgi:hypothetical protein
MKIIDFASEITKKEGGNVNVTIAQVSEVLRLINASLWGIPYLLIKLRRVK